LYPHTNGNAAASWWPRLCIELSGLIAPSRPAGAFVRLAHWEVRRVVHRRYIAAAPDTTGAARDWHLALAAFFEGHPAELRGSAEQLHHLHTAGQWGELAAAVTSQRCLRAFSVPGQGALAKAQLDAAYTEHFVAARRQLPVLVGSLLRSAYDEEHRLIRAQAQLRLHNWKRRVAEGGEGDTPVAKGSGLIGRLAELQNELMRGDSWGHQDPSIWRHMARLLLRCGEDEAAAAISMIALSIYRTRVMHGEAWLRVSVWRLRVARDKPGGVKVRWNAKLAVMSQQSGAHDWRVVCDHGEVLAAGILPYMDT